MPPGISFNGAAGEAKPKLTVEHFLQLAPSRECVATVQAARFVTFMDEHNRPQERSLFVEFQEWPGLELKCNRTMAAAFEKLVKAGKLPNQTDGPDRPQWAGCRVALQLQGFRNPKGGADVEKPIPCHPDLHDARIRAYFAELTARAVKSAPPPPPPAPAPVPAKSPKPAPRKGRK